MVPRRPGRKSRRPRPWRKAVRRLVLGAVRAGAGALLGYLAERKPVAPAQPRADDQQTRASIPNRYDVIVVGAGPAGNTAAYLMARWGLGVLLVERGPVPGSKNVGGAAVAVQIWQHLVPELLPAFFEEHPYERILTRQEYWVMAEDYLVNLGVQGPGYARPPYNRVSALKARLDPWLAGQAVAAGATILTGRRVDEVIKDGGQAVGVRVDRGVGDDGRGTREFYADVIVLAEGVNPIVSWKAGYLRMPSAGGQSLYVKETMALPPDEIERRFGLRENEGAVIALYGYPTAGLNGTASLYTYRESLGLNVGASVAGLAKAGLNPNQLLERVKAHPSIAALIRGAETIEYSAHLIPDSGFNGVPKLAHPGALIIGDAASLVNGTLGIVPAMVSAKAAAAAVVQAKTVGDFSERSLRQYPRLLSQTFAWKDLRLNRLAKGYLDTHPHIFDTYARVVTQAAHEASMVYPDTSRQRRRRVLAAVRRVVPLSRLARDAVQAAWVEY